MILSTPAKIFFYAKVTVGPETKCTILSLESCVRRGVGRSTRTFKEGKVSMKIHQQLGTWEGQVPTQLLLHGVAYLDFLNDSFLD